MNIEDIIKYTSVSSTEIQGKFDSLGFKVSPDGKRLLKCRKELQGVIVVPKGIVSICDEAFKECTGMCGVIFPSSLKYIGRDCFKNRCIEHVDFPNSLKYIGPNAFAKTRLKEIDLSNTKLKELTDGVFSGSADLRLLKLPRTLIKIGKEAVSKATFKVLEIPDSVEVLDDYAIQSYELRRIVFPSSLKVLGIRPIGYHTEGTIAIDNLNDNFQYVDNTLYNSDKSIIYFTNKRNLKVPNSVNYIYPDAFAGEMISFSEESCLKEIPDNCFTAIQNIELHSRKNLKRIGKKAFSRCGFERFIIPCGVKTIDDGAFYECYSLKEIYIPSSVEYISNEAFEECYIEKIIVPKGFLKKYKNKLSEYADLIVEKEIQYKYAGSTDFSIDEYLEENEFENIKYPEKKYNINVKIQVDESISNLGFILSDIEMIHETNGMIRISCKLEGRTKEFFTINIAYYNSDNKVFQTEILELVSEDKYKKYTIHFIDHYVTFEREMKDLSKIRFYI